MNNCPPLITITDRRARALMPDARREARRQGVPVAVVVERGRCWLWRADWLRSAIAKEDERCASKRSRLPNLFSDLTIVHVAVPD